MRKLWKKNEKKTRRRKKKRRKEKRRGIEEREEDGRKHGVRRKGCTTPYGVVVTPVGSIPNWMDPI